MLSVIFPVGRHINHASGLELRHDFINESVLHNAPFFVLCLVPRVREIQLKSTQTIISKTII
jgi:hypothetical protein